MRLCRGALTGTVGGANVEGQPLTAMSEKQLSALLAKLKDDADLREKLEGAADLDAFLAIVKQAGFDVIKVDWLKYQARQTLELSDAELQEVAGGAVSQCLEVCGGPKHWACGVTIDSCFYNPGLG